MSTEVHGKLFTRKEDIPSTKHKKTKVRTANLCFVKIKILRFDIERKIHIERFQDSPDHTHDLEEIEKEAVKNYLMLAIVDAIKEYAAEKMNLDSTHKTNRYDWRLFTLYIQDGYGCWDVGGHFFVSNEDSNTLLETSVFLADQSSIEAKSIVIAFPSLQKDYIVFEFWVKKISVASIDDIFREIHKFPFPIQKLIVNEILFVKSRIEKDKDLPGLMSFKYQCLFFHKYMLSYKHIFHKQIHDPRKLLTIISWKQFQQTFDETAENRKLTVNKLMERTRNEYWNIEENGDEKEKRKFLERLKTYYSEFKRVKRQFWKEQELEEQSDIELINGMEEEKFMDNINKIEDKLDNIIKFILHNMKQTGNDNNKGNDHDDNFNISLIAQTTTDNYDDSKNLAFYDIIDITPGSNSDFVQSLSNDVINTNRKTDLGGRSLTTPPLEVRRLHVIVSQGETQSESSNTVRNNTQLKETTWEAEFILTDEQNIMNLEEDNFNNDSNTGTQEWQQVTNRKGKQKVVDNDTTNKNQETTTVKDNESIILFEDINETNINGVKPLGLRNTKFGRLLHEFWKSSIDKE
ncbi:hypothetical protein Glove_856g19 [Diversispora epigaea]|uniref:Uncharacterized protein n=1 Tax=Diversispora epigaea TaxID=1348612 RepID=A0A397G2I3_9GLOM|nr:hypothetical protein Glove_856g19 [Diversispora epigaea]